VVSETIGAESRWSATWLFSPIRYNMMRGAVGDIDVIQQTMFTTIIPVHNRAKLIRATLKSVVTQQGADQQVILVDDGSTDGIEQVLAEFGTRITVLKQDQQGQGAARNLALEHARGEYIAFIDSDDLWLPWTLATYRQAIEEFERPAFIASDEWTFTDQNASGNLSGLYQASLRAVVYEDYYASGTEGGWVPLCGAVVRADVLRAVGGFSHQEGNFEDTDLWLRLGTSKGFVRIDAPFCSARREHASTMPHDLPQTIAGIGHLIAQECGGHYPGDKQRRQQRLDILTRHVRPVTLDCLRQGRIADAWRLYFKSLRWHLRLGRLRYVIGFVFKVWAAARRRRGKCPESGVGDHGACRFNRYR
jgi:glycosyltransferase involved in cell wall biosynthesis